MLSRKEIFDNLIKKADTEGVINPFAFSLGIVESIIDGAPEEVRAYILNEISEYLSES